MSYEVQNLQQPMRAWNIAVQRVTYLTEFNHPPRYEHVYRELRHEHIIERLNFYFSLRFWPEEWEERAPG